MWCRYRDGLFRSRFSDRQPRYFSLLVQRKVSKRNDTRISPLSCASRFLQGLAKGASCPFANERHPCRSPSGESSKKLRCSGSKYGSKTIPNMSGFQKYLLALRPTTLGRNFPYAAPSTEAFGRISPPGSPQGCGAQDQSGIRVAFSLDTCFDDT